MIYQSLLKKAELFNSTVNSNFDYLSKGLKESTDALGRAFETINDMQNQIDALKNHIDTLKNEFEQYKKDNTKWRL